MHIEMLLDDGFLFLAGLGALRIEFCPADAITHHQPLGMFLEGLGLMRERGVLSFVQQQGNALFQALQLVLRGAHEFFLGGGFLACKAAGVDSQH